MRALEGHTVQRPDGRWATPATERQLAELLQVMAGAGASLGRDVKLSRANLSKVLRIEVKSGLAEVETGITLQALESSLRERHLTLGPLPPPALALTLADFIEGPFAGMRAVSPARLEPICLSLHGLTALGQPIATAQAPRSAAGPDLMALFLGAGGRLALTTRAVVRCLPQVPKSPTLLFSFSSAGSLVAALVASVTDGLNPAYARAERRAERWVLELEPYGGADSVVRDRTTLEKRVFDVGGRPSSRDSAETAIATAPVAPWVEASWPKVLAALEGGDALALHRLSLGGAVVNGRCEGLDLDRGAPWNAGAGLAKALDPRGVLGGAP